MQVEKRIFVILVAILAISLTTGCGKEPGEKIQLQLNLQAGESYNLRMTTTQEISQEPMGQKQDMTQAIGMGYTFDVEEVDADGVASVNITYNWVLFRQDGPMGLIEYDSSDPPAVIPPMAVGFAAIVGQSFSMKISRDGVAGEVQGMDEIMKRMVERMDLPEGTTRASMEENLTGQFGDQSAKDMMQGMAAVYPGKPVGIGESWSKKIVISKGFPMIVDYNFTLKARKNGVAVIEERSRIKSDPEATGIEAGGMKLRYDISGDQKGTLEIEEATGWHVSSKWTQEFSGQIKMETPSGDMSWPMSAKSTIIYERVD